MSVPDMGHEQDISQQQALVQVADDDLRNKVLDARCLIYEKNYAINTPVVEKLLKDESLIPTLVHVDPMGAPVFMLTRAEHCFRETPHVQVQCFCHAHS